MAFPLGATAIYAGLLALIAVALGLNVSRVRLREGVDLGDGGRMPLLQATRAFANFAEYVPLALLVIALVEWAQAPRWLVHALGIALVVGRLAHAAGLLSAPGRSTGRALGIGLTWLVLVVAGALALYYGLIRQA